MEQRNCHIIEVSSHWIHSNPNPQPTSGTGDWTQSPMHARQVRYHWATSPAHSNSDSAEEHWEESLGLGSSLGPATTHIFNPSGPEFLHLGQIRGQIRSSHRTSIMGQFCRTSGLIISKYFYSCQLKAATNHSINTWAWLCFNKALFIKKHRWEGPTFGAWTIIWRHLD